MTISTLMIKPPVSQETDTLEFTREATLHTLAPSIVAMLNHQGGAIYAGYSETGELIGLPADAATLAERLTEQLSQAISPEEAFQITLQEEQGKTGLLIEVPPGVRGPYVFDGRIYVRVGGANRPATAAMLSRMIAEREGAETRWERRLAIGIEADALDAVEIGRCVKAADTRYLRTEDPVEATPLSQLERLDLAHDGWPTHGAVILFKTEKVRQYSQATVRAVAFADEALTRILNEEMLTGGAFFLFERLYAFLQLHLQASSYLPPGSLQRLEMPAYPEWVLREAIVNALIHRDYQDQATVQVRLFLDRLEIWNPGEFPPGYGHNPAAQTVSRPRNPDLARIFHLRGYAEMLGIGLWRIRQEMARAELPPPEWRSESGGVMLTLSQRRRRPSAIRTPGADDLLPRLTAFLAATKPGERFTRERYRNRFAPGISERSARNDLRALQEHGYLRQAGSGYYTAYVRTEKLMDLSDSSLPLPL